MKPDDHIDKVIAYSTFILIIILALIGLGYCIQFIIGLLVFISMGG